MSDIRHLAGDVSPEEQALAAALLDLQRVADRLSRTCREGLLALQAQSTTAADRSRDATLLEVTR
ncbi:MAG TPA: hypothetical protein VKA30_09855 [Actinomycetota bacterium]|nr:hypothetical protein [Actinomycetota bacterium]